MFSSCTYMIVKKRTRLQYSILYEYLYLKGYINIKCPRNNKLRKKHNFIEQNIFSASYIKEMHITSSLESKNVTRQHIGHLFMINFLDVCTNTSRYVAVFKLLNEIYFSHLSFVFCCKNTLTSIPLCFKKMYITKCNPYI